MKRDFVGAASRERSTRGTEQTNRDVEVDGWAIARHWDEWMDSVLLLVLLSLLLLLLLLLLFLVLMNVFN